MAHKPLHVTKELGTQEPFSENKLCSSLIDAGAPEHIAKSVCSQVTQKIKPNISTTNIYRTALEYLLKEDLDAAFHYSLRRGVALLGPAGFLFEQYLEALLQKHGYITKRNIVIQGECVDHEIDIYAEKGDLRYLVEAKYRNESGIKTHVDVVMYADARLMDIERQNKKKKSKNFNHTMWVITNTKFTGNAISYAKCRNVRLVGWNYPKEGNLEDMIVRKKHYPITVLPSVNEMIREMLVKHNIILAQDLIPYSAQDLQKQFGIPKQAAHNIADEVSHLRSS